MRRDIVDSLIYKSWQISIDHPRRDSTLIYTHLVSFEADAYHHAASKTIKEACELIDAGFEYVTEQDGIKLWLRRK